MFIITAIGQALFTAFSMLWEILWPLILGFTLSGIVQAVVSHQSMAKVLGGDSPKNLTLATLFGFASSSCSYAAVALARSIFQKGASFTSAMVFELASTNLVTFYITMAAAGYVVEFLFEALGIIPQNRNIVSITQGIQWNYTTVLNIIFLVLAALLVIRFIRTGGLPMLKMMGTPEHDMSHHEQARSPLDA